MPISPIRLLRKCQNWSDFKSSLDNRIEKDKGDAFEILTQHYLKLDPTYQTKLAAVWNLNKGEVPPRIQKKLNLPDGDEGIDLVAETVNGDYWAIQCKYRSDEDHSLTRRDLSTFTDLAFNICNEIDFALVCTTADRFSYKLKLYGDRIGFCAGDTWRALDEAFFKRLHQSLAGKKTLPKPLEPRPHQRRAIRNAHKHFDTRRQSRGKLIMPCGTGKSLAGYWIASKLEAKRILIAVPSLALIKQTLEVWARESVANKWDIHWIAVCSDESVGQSERDDVAVLTQDLGVEVTTDIEKTAAFLSKRRRNKATVLFTTYQSGRVTAEAAKRAGITFDLGILDEAHKTVGKRGSLFAHLLYDETVRIKKRIFMTATERRYRGMSNEIASMDNPALYGDTFELLTFKEALETDPAILSDYKVCTIGVNRDEVNQLIQRNAYVKPDKGRWDHDIEARALASVIALRKAMEKYPIRHAVSFHSSIVRAVAYQKTQDSFTRTFPKYGDLETFHVRGAMPTAVRSREIAEFAAARRSLITNARCLTEGVDVPDIDCVLFADPKQSTIDIVQATGRALRSLKGKQFGYVIVPVLLDSVDDRELGKTAFETVLTVLRSLASNDDRIVEYFRSISEGRRPTDRVVEFDFEISLGTKVDADEFVDSVALEVWSRLAKMSRRPFEEARAFVHSLRLSDNREWRRYCAGELPEKGTRPDDIPAAPERIYKSDGWSHWGDWLGTRRPRIFRNFRPFEDARRFARQLGLRDSHEWYAYCRGELPDKVKKPDDIPYGPVSAYRNQGWISMGDWLGTGYVAPKMRQYREFKAAREFVHQLGFKNHDEWRRYCNGELLEKGRKPDDIPTLPNRVYAQTGWITWGDWLQTGNISPLKKAFRPFEEARAFVHELDLTSSSQWPDYCQGKLRDKGKKPDDIPVNPGKVYKDQGWISFRDWLGISWLPYAEARAYVRALKLKNFEEWDRYRQGQLLSKGQRHKHIPSNPNAVYKDKGWTNLADWLGTGRRPSGQWRSFGEARAFVHKLKLRHMKKWRLYCDGELPDIPRKPEDIPRDPTSAYKSKGWQGSADWLNTAHRRGGWRPFNDARKYVRNLGLRSETEWRKFRNGEFVREKGALPTDIPKAPDQLYKKKGWVSWPDWLGTDTGIK